MGALEPLPDRIQEPRLEPKLEMRTRPLPNRHADDLDNLFQVVQATLNRHRGKPDLDTLTLEEILKYQNEERKETVLEALAQTHNVRYYADTSQVYKLERECADGVVTYLMMFLYARKLARGEIAIKGLESPE